MCRGRTDEINMSSGTAWTGSMTTLPFVSQPANCSTLLWPQLQKSWPRSSWRFGGQSVSSCQRNAVALLERRSSVTSWQSSARYPGAWPDKDRWTSVAILNTTRCRTVWLRRERSRNRIRAVDSIAFFTKTNAAHIAFGAGYTAILSRALVLKSIQPLIIQLSKLSNTVLEYGRRPHNISTPSRQKTLLHLTPREQLLC